MTVFIERQLAGSSLRDAGAWEQWDDSYGGHNHFARCIYRIWGLGARSSILGLLHGVVPIQAHNQGVLVLVFFKLIALQLAVSTSTTYQY